jgi:putative transcriptional regulator
MNRGKDYPSLTKEVSKQLALKPGRPCAKVRVSLATVNRWENGQSTPSKLAKAQVDSFCIKMTEEGRLKLSHCFGIGGEHGPVDQKKTETDLVITQLWY